MLRIFLVFFVLFHIIGCDNVSDSQNANSTDQLAQLINKLKSEGPTQKFTVVEKIGKLGENAAPAIPQLKKLAMDPKSGDRLVKAIIETLIKIGEDALLALKELLTHCKWEHKLYILKNLSQLSVENLSKMFSSIENCLNDNNSQIRDEAAELLANLNEKAIPLLINKAQDPTWQVRKTVAESLATIKNQKGLETLRLLSNDKDWRVRMMAIKGLIEIGFNDSNVLSEVILTSEEDKRIKGTITELLIAKIDLHKTKICISNDATAYLVTSLQDKKNFRSTFAIKMLLNIEPNILKINLLENINTQKNLTNTLDIIEKLDTTHQKMYCEALSTVKSSDQNIQRKINKIIQNQK